MTRRDLTADELKWIRENRPAEWQAIQALLADEQRRQVRKSLPKVGTNFIIPRGQPKQTTSELRL
jgi:hypothetical protein